MSRTPSISESTSLTGTGREPLPFVASTHVAVPTDTSAVTGTTFTDIALRSRLTASIDLGGPLSDRDAPTTEPSSFDGWSTLPWASIETASAIPVADTTLA